MLRSLLTVTVLLLGSCAAATPVVNCDNPYDALSESATQYNNVTEERLNADDSLTFVSAYNATEPVTNYVVDFVSLFFIRGTNTTIMTFVKDGCVIYMEEAPTLVIQMFKSGRPIPRQRELS